MVISNINCHLCNPINETTENWSCMNPNPHVQVMTSFLCHPPRGGIIKLEGSLYWGCVPSHLPHWDLMITQLKFELTIELSFKQGAKEEGCYGLARCWASPAIANSVALNTWSLQSFGDPSLHSNEHDQFDLLVLRHSNSNRQESLYEDNGFSA